MNLAFIKILVLSALLIFASSGVSGANFSDSEEILVNRVTNGFWEAFPSPSPSPLLSPLPSPSVTPSPSPSPSPTSVVINEVYYDVDSSHGVEGTNEWIEIYNPTTATIDISGWIVKDNISSDTIPTSAPIPSSGYALITPSSGTFSFWSIPAGVILITLDDSRIGNGLANGGDRVILALPSEDEVDAVSWGSNTDVFTPSVIDVSEGHSISRKPAGFDTDSAADWIDTHSGSSPAGPNPGTNP